EEQRLDIGGRAPARFPRQPVGETQELPGRLLDRPALVLRENQDPAAHGQITPVFSRMRRTSSRATSSAAPFRISAPFPLVGGASRPPRSRAARPPTCAGSRPRSRRPAVRISFFFAAMIPLRLA